MTGFLSSNRTVDPHRAPHRLATSLPLLLLVVVLCSTSGLAQWGGHLPPPWEVKATPIDLMALEPDVVERLLTAYDTGRYADFDRLAGPIASSLINPFEFEVDADGWIETGLDRRRRAFVAAAVALELANTPLRRTGEIVFERLAIDTRFVLAELGCAWLRDHPPSAAERPWRCGLRCPGASHESGGLRHSHCTTLGGQNGPAHRVASEGDSVVHPVCRTPG